MNSRDELSRRSFLALTATAPAFAAPSRGSQIPVGLELYSVREELKKDLMGTVRAVAKMGYQGVEFYAPYFDWTTETATDVRKLLDELGIRCFSTHNSAKNFLPENLPKAIELNRIIGSKFIVMASSGKVEGLDGWKSVAEKLNRGAERMKPDGLRAGYHNHTLEFLPVDGKRPMDVLAANTDKSVALQLDVGACLEAGADPIAWIDQNPGRIASLHLKDWSPEPAKGFKVLIGEGVVPWKKLLKAASTTGGAEYYLIEQEGSAYPPLETVERCLATFKKLRKA